MSISLAGTAATFERRSFISRMARLMQERTHMNVAICAGIIAIPLVVITGFATDHSAGQGIQARGGQLVSLGTLPRG